MSCITFKVSSAVSLKQDVGAQMYNKHGYCSLVKISSVLLVNKCKWSGQNQEVCSVG